ncbi:hypothetical protein O7599_35035 [Streptomyces sp. WMMC500]|nr:hypothetical protein [Streptomyces sp. WMMC500]WBB60658.1 hypothetical protein O7599_35035 [Streptomyces sp. WMMC500]
MGDTRTANEELSGLWFSTGDEDGPIPTRAHGPRAGACRGARG